MPESALEYLSSHQLLFLATATSAGDVHIAPMFYANQDRAIFFSAPDGSTTAVNLRDNPVAAAAIADPPETWASARGLQIEGPVAELDGEIEEEVGRLFQAKFPHLGDAAMHTHYWRLDAEQLHYVHNDEGGADRWESLGTTWSRETIA